MDTQAFNHAAVFTGENPNGQTPPPSDEPDDVPGGQPKNTFGGNSRRSWVKERKKVMAGSRAMVIMRRENDLFSKSEVWVESENFYGGKLPQDTFLIIGFDTEFKTPEDPVGRIDIQEGRANFEVLSYQVHCKLFDPAQPDAREWGGICYPREKGQRLTLADVLTFALWKGIQSGAVTMLPTKIYLVGHFTRADVPAFADFKSLTEMISAVRNTFLSVGDSIPIEIHFPTGPPTLVTVILRDTMLLTPATSKSLKALGELVGQEKIVLDPDPAKAQWYKANMDVLLEEQPALFERYALNDAVICVRYMDQLLAQCREILGTTKVPATLTGIGVDLLLRTWRDGGTDADAVLGKEEVQERRYSPRLGHYLTKKVKVNLEEFDRHLQQATECYHGGRGEQFWFGPSFEADWTDYDLSGAYPTAMALIKTPDWRAAYVTLDPDEFTATTLGVATVEFEFPESTRFPTLPVRTDNGLVFPLKGISNCAAPEIALARSLGAKLKIRHGVVVPSLDDTSVFGVFIRDCVQKRRENPKGSLRNLFWKELSNSSYGKTAQGLHKKRVYDLRTHDTKPLPPSLITNAFYAAFITSFVRAVLGEILNSLPSGVTVFSCTTDGFLTDADDHQIAAAQMGPLATLFGLSRVALTGDDAVLEIKHKCRQLLGWRTRGQATLAEGESNEGDGVNIVLAKGGIYTAAHLDDVRLQNDFIVDLFLNRTPKSVIRVQSMTGIRDMVDFDADLVTKVMSKRLNMEFDWKRRPAAVAMSNSIPHISFSTKPWGSVEEFQAVRSYWEDLAGDDPFCIKTLADYQRFAVHVLTRSALGHEGSRYLKKRDPDIKRLRQVLGSAWRHSRAGLVWREGGLSATGFAEILTGARISCSRADVENAGRLPFQPRRCPPTPEVIAALTRLRQIFPRLEAEELLASCVGQIDLLSAIDAGANPSAGAAPGRAAFPSTPV